MSNEKAKSIRINIYNLFYDMHVIERLDEAGIYKKDAFLYEELVTECNDLQLEYLSEVSKYCPQCRQILDQEVKDEDESKCIHERTIYDYFFQAKDKVMSKWNLVA